MFQVASGCSTDVDRILRFYAEEAIYEDVPSVENGWAEPWRGREMIREALVEMFAAMPDLRFQLVSVWSADDWLVVEWIMTGTQTGDFSGLPATGRTIEIRGISISHVEFESGRITLQRDYYDMFLFLSQLGVVPPMRE